jgi:hypothetical protein
MPKTELVRLLAELETELRQDPDLGAEDRQALLEMQGRIESLLQRERPIETAGGEEFLSPITEYVDRLESAHPTTTMILGRIADALNKLGI